MMARLALPVIFSGALLAGVGATPVCAQDPATPVGAPTPALNWPAPVEDHRVFNYINFDELEGRTNARYTAFRWDGEGWIGSDFNKLWIKSEGTVTNGVTSDGDQEILYARPIPHTRYLDWQAGARIDLDSGPTRAWVALGIEGLAPYQFNFAPTIYIRDGGRVAGRLQGYYDLYLTQRLILQPQVELNFYSQVDPGRKTGTGLSDIDGGVRLGYQFSRKFAPYVGYVYSAVFGGTARFSVLAVEPTSASQFVFGIWVWR